MAASGESSAGRAGGPIARLHDAFFRLVRWATVGLACVAGTSFVAMIVVTCSDVVLRKLGHPLLGALDVIGICGALGAACALPYTTAVKGHVAIEYFYHKFGRVGRAIVNSFVHVAAMGMFTLLAAWIWIYGIALLERNVHTPTLQVPMFWVPMLISASCGLLVLVLLHGLLHPGKEFMKP